VIHLLRITSLNLSLGRLQPVASASCISKTYPGIFFFVWEVRTMYIETLGIELTRRCNLKCAHCLRGGAQRKDMDVQTIRRLFTKQGLKSVNTVVLSGGEPSLVPHIIEDFTRMLYDLDQKIGFFYMATNGTHVTDKFISAIRLLLGRCWDPALCNIAVSMDVYHKREDHRRRALQGLYMMKDYIPEIDINTRDEEPRSQRVLGQGRAKTNQISCDIPRDTKIEYIDGYEEISGPLYLNCEGYVIQGCDWSYIEQKKHRLFHVKQPGHILDLLGLERAAA